MGIDESMLTQFSRTELLLGKEAVERLAHSRVAVFGLGGVGGAAAEALARCGVGALELFDNDRVSLTNLNRQIVATHLTVGQYKTEAMRARLLSINPEAEVICHNLFYLPETAGQVDFARYDYVVDAIDTVAAKIDIAARCADLGVPIISAMGAGNKLDPTALRVADIYETKVCPLARVMRRELKKRGVGGLKVVYSEEVPLSPRADVETDGGARRAVPGSVSFVPPVAGYILAGEVIKDLCAKSGEERR
jgi:tRNA A37 threonylcarbamoyladenosine dehydratase